MSEAAELVFSRIERLSRIGDDRAMGECPAHVDRQRSLSARVLPDGRVLLHCFAGCPIQEVLGALSLSLTDLFPRAVGHHFKPEARPFPATDVIRVVASEAMAVAVVMAHLVEGKPLPQEYRERGALAATRLLNAADVAIPPKDRRREYRAAKAMAGGQCV